VRTVTLPRPEADAGPVTGVVTLYHRSGAKYARWKPVGTFGSWRDAVAASDGPGDWWFSTNGDSKD
jgi:hypothetical protein